MIVVLRPGATDRQREAVLARVAALGMKAHTIVGVERTVIAAVGDERVKNQKATLETLDGVEKVVPILTPYKMASAEVRPGRTVVAAGPDGRLQFGGPAVAVVAGPCSVESEEQIVSTARAVAAAGATGLRGGAFKPRTSPYSFQGLREEGLKLLAAAREATGLPVVTEVMAPHQVDLVARYADVLQIGARNMQNYDLLTECAKPNKPVLLKRGPAASIEEFLLAAEYVLDAGNPHVVLCERGIRTFETHTRFTLPLASVPYLKQRTHLPVVIDPAHGTGVASLVGPMSKAAVACGADGLLVEVHPDPAAAWSDGAQTLPFDQFAALMSDLTRLAPAVGRSIAGT